MKENNCKGKNMLVYSTILASTLADTYSDEELAELTAFLSALVSSISLILISSGDTGIIVTSS